MTPVIIAFHGKKYSGKDTAARALTIVPGWTHESFAAPIRAAARALLDIDEVELNRIKHEPQEVLGGKRLRDFMQLMGTEFGRDMIHPDMWRQALKYRIRDKKKVVITDLRFVNEAALVHSLGGIIIKIERPSLTEEDAHRSEVELHSELIDHVIVNDGSIYQLHQRVKSIYRDLVREVKCTRGL